MLLNIVLGLHLVVCLHLGRGTGNPGFDTALDLVCAGHMLEA